MPSNVILACVPQFGACPIFGNSYAQAVNNRSFAVFPC
jgi:hypothetical protein